jgi:hypothetical protein
MTDQEMQRGRDPQTGLARYNEIFDSVEDLVVLGQASLWI